MQEVTNTTEHIFWSSKEKLPNPKPDSPIVQFLKNLELHNTKSHILIEFLLIDATTRTFLASRITEKIGIEKFDEYFCGSPC